MSNRCAAAPGRGAHDLTRARMLIGQRVRVLLHDQYYFNDEKCLGDIGSIEWRFGEDLVISMYLLGDGECVGADLLPLGPPLSFELDSGDKCSWCREDLIEALAARHLVGVTIQDVQGIVDTWPDQRGYLTGFKVVFETGDFLIFLNQGDEAVMLLNELPPEADGILTTWVSHIE